MQDIIPETDRLQHRLDDLAAALRTEWANLSMLDLNPRGEQTFQALENIRTLIEVASALVTDDVQRVWFYGGDTVVGSTGLVDEDSYPTLEELGIDEWRDER